MMWTRLIVLCPGKYTPHRSLREHPFLLALRRWGRFARRNWIAPSVWNFCRWVADVPPRETSPAAKSEEKRMFTQAAHREQVDILNAVKRKKLRREILFNITWFLTVIQVIISAWSRLAPGTRIPPATQDRSRRPYVIGEKWSRLLDLTSYVWI